MSITTFTRRGLAGVAAAGVLAAGRPVLAQAPASTAPEPAPSWRELVAAPKEVRLVAEDGKKDAALWLFDGAQAAPVIRVTQGEEVRIRFVNNTTGPLSLHWHGVRNINAMDGVGALTQAPVQPGARFEYRFTPPDAGTFLVRPMQPSGSSEAGGRGLCALLIVQEKQPPKVDADLCCVVQDWRLAEDGTLAPFHDAAQAAFLGRLGGRITVNGQPIPETIALAPGSRVRLRLVNACNARILRIRFDGIKVFVAAIDGQPTDTFEPLRASLPFPPGTRYDLLLDVASEPGPSGAVVALVGQGAPLVQFVAKGEPANRPALSAIAASPPNAALPAQIRLQNALRRDVAITGGASRGPAGEPVYSGDPKAIWQINGKAGAGAGTPLFSVKRGTPVVLSLMNQTPLPQPFHLHGHCFRLLHALDDGWEPYWLDTLQVPEAKTSQIAFVADNVGKWALCSTVLERFDTGLWTWFEVT